MFGDVLLGGVGLVVHEEEVEVTGVVDKERLVAGGHHVAGLLVAAVTDLYRKKSTVSVSVLSSYSSYPMLPQSQALLRSFHPVPVQSPPLVPGFLGMYTPLAWQHGRRNVFSWHCRYPLASSSSRQRA